MKILYFDCFSGISGDMTVGALLDLGIDHEVFRKEMAKLDVHGLEIHIEKKNVNGMAGTDFDVHTHSHGHGHEHSHKHEHRHLSDVAAIIEKSGLSNRAKDLSKRIFTEIASAEARVHGSDINEVHFHEVGALDSIADIIGTAVCIDLLGIEKVYSSELHDGHGMIKCAHGMLPVPVPAVMEMLKNTQIPFVQDDINTELITPTGMAIIKTISERYGRMPQMKVNASGLGFGKRDTGRLNALRVVMGETDNQAMEGTITVLETNIDNMSSEILSFAMDKLFEAGALDAYYTPVYMKKSRPAVMLTVLAADEKVQAITDSILKNTSTLGVRMYKAQRTCLSRDFVTIKTEFGEIKIKTALLPDGSVKASPEFEDCRSAAVRTGKPIAAIMDNAMDIYRQLRKNT